MTNEQLTAALDKMAASKERKRLHPRHQAKAYISISDLTPEEQEERRKANRDKYFAYQLAWRADHKDEVNAKRRAKRAELKAKEQ